MAATVSAPLKVSFQLSGMFDETSRYMFVVRPGETKTTLQSVSGSEIKTEQVALRCCSSLDTAWKVFISKKTFLRVKYHNAPGACLKVSHGKNCSSYPVKVIICIEGVTQDGFRPYKLRIDPDEDPFKIKGWLEQDDGMESKCPVLQEALKGFNRRNFKKFLPNLESALQVHATSQNLSLSLAPGDKMAAAAALPPEVVQPPKMTFLDVHNVTGLVQLLNSSPNPDPLLIKIYHKILNEYPTPTQEELKEMGRIFLTWSGYDGFSCLNRMFASYNESSLCDHLTLDNLTVLLSFYYRKCVLSVLASKDKEGAVDVAFLEGMSDTQLERMLVLLTIELTNGLRKKNWPLIRRQLRTTLALLDALNVNHSIGTQAHRLAYMSIKGFEGCEDLETAYLANYGVQTFARIHKKCKRMFYLARALANIVEPVELAQSVHFIKAFKALPDLASALKAKEIPAMWSDQFLLVRHSFYVESPQILHDLLEGTGIFREHRKESLFHDMCFVMTLTHFLWEILHTPHFSIAIQTTALKLLREIGLSNLEGTEFNKFELIAPYKSQIGFLASQRIHSCKDHRDSQLCQLAKEFAAECEPFIEFATLSSPPFVFLDSSRDIFVKAARKSAPLLFSLQRIKAHLENDPQLVRERPRFIEPFGRKNDQTEPAPLFQQLRDFLDSKNKSLMVETDEGGGKSLSLKVFAEQLMEEERWFPIFVPLPTIKDPVYKLLNETFALYELDVNQQDTLHERAVVVIVDGVNEVPFIRSNLYSLNRFDSYPKMKVIFLCRNGASHPNQFRSQGYETQRLLIDPFKPHG